MASPLFFFAAEMERNAAGPLSPSAICGVGPVEAAIGAAQSIDRLAPSEIVFLGTCGAHRGRGIEIGDLVVAARVSLGSGDVASGTMRFPTIMPATVMPDERLSAALVDYAVAAGFASRVHRASVCCTIGITENDDLALRLARYDESDVENLEAFSVLRAASPRPAAALLAVTNFVGDGGGAGWVANYRAGMADVGAIAREMLTERSR